MTAATSKWALWHAVKVSIGSLGRRAASCQVPDKLASGMEIAETFASHSVFVDYFYLTILFIRQLSITLKDMSELTSGLVSICFLLIRLFLVIMRPPGTRDI